MMQLPVDFYLDKYGLQVRFVNESDADFIVRLRTDKELSQFLHPISPDVDIQRMWIREYKLREKEGQDYYFVFSLSGEILGLERIYDIRNDSFTHGSLVFDRSAPLGTSILADIITREIAFEILDLSKNYFDVRKGNINVRNYHQRYNPVFLQEDSESYYYLLEKANFECNKNKYLKLFCNVGNK